MAHYLHTERVSLTLCHNIVPHELCPEMVSAWISEKMNTPILYSQILASVKAEDDGKTRKIIFGFKMPKCGSRDKDVIKDGTYMIPLKYVSVPGRGYENTVLYATRTIKESELDEDEAKSETREYKSNKRPPSGLLKKYKKLGKATGSERDTYLKALM